MRLGEIAQGVTATLVAATPCGGTMQGEQLEAGVRVRVAWHHPNEAPRTTFVDVLSGARAGALVHCPLDAEVGEPDLARVDVEATVRGLKQDDDLDPLRREPSAFETAQRPALQGTEEHAPASGCVGAEAPKGESGARGSTPAAPSGSRTGGSRASRGEAARPARGRPKR